MPRRVVESRLEGAPFGVVLADPPWTYRDKATPGERGVAFKYGTMTTREIAEVDVAAVVDRDALLFLWATPPLLDDARLVMAAWGFEYVTFAFSWVKLSSETGLLHWGMGNWTRANVEPVLLGSRGRPARASRAVHQVVVAPVDPIVHSRKPAEVRRRIEMLAESDRRLELFATERSPGWTSVGYGADGRDVRDALDRREVDWALVARARRELARF